MISVAKLVPVDYGGGYTYNGSKKILQIGDGMIPQVITVTSKGQIAIPVNIRKQLGISDGTKLALYVSDDIVMLKPVKIPTPEEFEEMLNRAQASAREANLTEEEVNEIIKSVRKKK